MSELPSISLITTCFNARDLLPVTLKSILRQSVLQDRGIDFEYIIVDAASKDDSLAVIREIAGDLNPRIICEEDRGMYDGLSKGFAASKGNIVGYINAGDFLHPTALEVLRDAFSDTDAKWMTGYNTLGNVRGQATRVELPYTYRNRYFETGLHGTLLPTMQQESTYWRRELMDGFDWEAFRKLRLAGDFMLWQHFSRTEPPAILHSLIGAFCSHPGQLSSDASGYVSELKSLCTRASPMESLLARLEGILWRAPTGVKRRLAGKRHIAYNHQDDRYEFV